MARFMALTMVVVCALFAPCRGRSLTILAVGASAASAAAAIAAAPAADDEQGRYAPQHQGLPPDASSPMLLLFSDQSPRTVRRSLAT